MPLWRGIKYTFKYHLGSVVMTAVIMPFVWPIKIFLQRIRKGLETKGENVSLKNMSRKYRFCLCLCVFPLIVYENFIKYISSRNLY